MVAQTKLRPNGIVLVVERPIVSLSKMLFEINLLRIHIRGLKDGNIS